MKRKIQINELKVKSFVTSLNEESKKEMLGASGVTCGTICGSYCGCITQLHCLPTLEPNCIQ